MTANYAVTAIDMKVTCRDAAGSLLGTRTLTVYLKSVDGNNTELKLLSETGYTCRYSYNDFPGTITDGTTVPKTGTNASKVTGISPSSSNTLYLSLFSGTTRIDFEDVPIVSDGEKGNNAVIYDIEFTEAWAKADASETITARLRGYAYKIVGDTRTPLIGATRAPLAGVIIRYGYDTNDSNTYVDTTTGPIFDFRQEWITMPSGKPGVVCTADMKCKFYGKNFYVAVIDTLYQY